jgi:hypothetical protein
MSIFFENLPIYYINLENRIDRNSLFLKQMKENNIQNYFRVNAFSKNDVPYEKYGMSKQEIACSISHMMALQEFILSKYDFAIICEDDVDLSNSNKMNFNFVEKFSHLKNSLFCIQTSIATRNEVDMNFKIHARSFWDFGTMSYIINKEYAKILLREYFWENKESFYNFVAKKVEDPRGGIIETKPVADELIYSLTETLSIPIFTYMLVESDICGSDEYYFQFQKGREDFIKYWLRYDIIDYKVMRL